METKTATKLYNILLYEIYDIMELFICEKLRIWFKKEHNTRYAIKKLYTCGGGSVKM